MSGTLITVSGNQGWLDKVRFLHIALRGKEEVRLINMSNNNQLAVAAGSMVEINGAIYIFDTDTLVSPWSLTSTGLDLYIRLNVDKPELTTIVPSWDQARSCYFAGGYRYLPYALIYSTPAVGSGEVVALPHQSTPVFATTFDGSNIISAYEQDINNMPGALIIRHSGTTMAADASFYHPELQRPEGIAWVNGNLITAGPSTVSGTNRLFVHDGFSQTITETFELSFYPRSLAWTGNHLLSGNQANDEVKVLKGVSSEVEETYEFTENITRPEFDGTNLLTINVDTSTIQVHQGLTTTVMTTLPIGSNVRDVLITDEGLYYSDYKNNTLYRFPEAGYNKMYLPTSDINTTITGGTA